MKRCIAIAAVIAALFLCPTAFAQNPNTDQLDPAKKQNQNHNSGVPQRERESKNLQYSVGETEKKGAEGYHEPGLSAQRQRII